MDLRVRWISALVATKKGENPFRRKGQGSVALIVSHRLAGPKWKGNSLSTKGKRVYIPVPWCSLATEGVFGTVLDSNPREGQAVKLPEYRNDEKGVKL